MSIQQVVVLLIEAASLGDDSSVKQILSERLLSVEDISRTDPRPNSTSYGLCALHRAKTAEVARVLLEYGIQVNCRGPSGQTPLHTNCDNPEVIKVLLEKGAQIDAKTNDGSTALEWAVVADSIDAVKLLIEKGANVLTTNKNGNTPLHLVTSKKMAEILLSFGAKVSIENLEGRIPLETAAERKGEPDFAAITELLLDVSEDRG
jgi:ankyrin repeat protein